MLRKRLSLILGLMGCTVAVLLFRAWQKPASTSVNRLAARPVLASTLEDAPSDVREFLGRVLEKLPEGGKGVSGYQFHHWEWKEKPTHEAVGIKAIPGVDPEKFLARVMDVNGYKANIAHVETCRSHQESSSPSPEKVAFYQEIDVPGVARVQQELVLVDVGTIKGYRVAYWYLLRDKTNALDPKIAARSDFNIGAWMAAPGVVGYALSSWPKREDVNALQWFSLTSGANALAKTIVEGNIDGMAKWAKKSEETASSR